MLLIPQNPAQFFKQIWIQENRSITPLGVIRDKKKREGDRGIRVILLRITVNPRTVITHRFAFVSDVLPVSGSWNEWPLSSKSFGIMVARI